MVRARCDALLPPSPPRARARGGREILMPREVKSAKPTSQLIPLNRPQLAANPLAIEHCFEESRALTGMRPSRACSVREMHIPWNVVEYHRPRRQYPFLLIRLLLVIDLHKNSLLIFLPLMRQLERLCQIFRFFPYRALKSVAREVEKPHPANAKGYAINRLYLAPGGVCNHNLHVGMDSTTFGGMLRHSGRSRKARR